MELFHEIYGCYYHVVGRILHQAYKNSLHRTQIEAIIAEHAFSESSLHLLPRLLSGEWDLLHCQDGRYTSKLDTADTALPLTNLQKSWLKALLQDARIRLFADDAQFADLHHYLKDVQPLFQQSDFQVFDAAVDGDCYQDAHYIDCFRLALRAIKTKKPLLADYQQSRGLQMQLYFLPQKMLYSEKNDMFQIAGYRLGGKKPTAIILNMMRILKLHSVDNEDIAIDTTIDSCATAKKRKASIAIYEERNALERCMLQFASYDKQTYYDHCSNCYICDIHYNALEETELLIRILSYGPAVKVLAPPSFLAQVKKRVALQVQRMNE